MGVFGLVRFNFLKKSPGEDLLVNPSGRNGERSDAKEYRKSFLYLLVSPPNTPEKNRIFGFHALIRTQLTYISQLTCLDATSL